MIKRYVITHETEGFVAAVYAERFELVPLRSRNSFNGNRPGNFFIGSDVVASLDNPRCWVGVSALSDESRSPENRGRCLTADEIAAINAENCAIAEAAKN
jgi:hypothetical protein